MSEKRVGVTLVSQRMGDRTYVRACLGEHGQVERVLLEVSFGRPVTPADAAVLLAEISAELKRQGSPIVVVPANAVGRA